MCALKRYPSASTPMGEARATKKTATARTKDVARADSR